MSLKEGHYLLQITCIISPNAYHNLSLLRGIEYLWCYLNMYILTYRVHYLELELQLIVGLSTLRGFGGTNN